MLNSDYTRGEILLLQVLYLYIQLYKPLNCPCKTLQSFFQFMSEHIGPNDSPYTVQGTEFGNPSEILTHRVQRPIPPPNQLLYRGCTVMLKLWIYNKIILKLWLNDK